MMNKVLTAYFSRPGYNYLGGEIVKLAVGNTRKAAEKANAAAGGDIFRIDTVRQYSEDYSACVEESRQEIRANARPELKEYLPDIDGYDTVILCYPCWCGTAPMAVFTFLQHYDFTGKTILPLCTNEGSGMGASEADIKKLCPGAQVKTGLSVRGGGVDGADEAIARWLSRSL